MKITEFLNNNIVLLDGGTGTLLQTAGLKPGELPELWNISHPNEVVSIHKSYFDAGSNVVCTNTFGANTLKYDFQTLEEIISSAIFNVRKAMGLSTGTQQKFVSLDIGPLGKLLKPYGTLDFEEAVSIFAETVKLGQKYGADLIYIETLTDGYETKAAILAAKENSDLPIFVSNAYGSDGKLLTGASPEAMSALIEGMGVCAFGANCSTGPIQLASVIDRLLAVASVPIIFKPNAGLPQSDGTFDITPDQFAKAVADKVKCGVRIVGGCCGTTPAHIKAVSEAIKGFSPLPIQDKKLTVISSYTHTVVFGNRPILIGERINPTGKKALRQAITDGNMSFILNEAIAETDAHSDVLDVNVGVPGIDESTVLTDAICRIQTVTNLPLQIDTADTEAMERAVRRYNGKPLINSVNGKRESMEKIFPIAKKYGGVIIALTLDENGIPSDADGRLKIAQKTVAAAESYGIDRRNLIFDTLAMAVSADKSAPTETLKAISLIRDKLGCNTSLGVSNVSFGLPCRDFINASFFTLALGRGLSAAIMNPFSTEMVKAYKSFSALSGLDENCTEYIGYAATVANSVTQNTDRGETTLKKAITRGLKESAAIETKALLKTEKPLDIINNHIIPALDEVGKGFEKQTVYLPQLLMSAEAAKNAFDVIKTSAKSEKSVAKCDFVLATVKGDIHDIGKNIVKLLLENYGYNVIDLGRDVPPETVLNAVVSSGAKLVGLSALMTTTLPAMKETVALLKAKAPECKIVVGGAVLTEEYSNSIGADKYASDAMETVRFAEAFCGF